MSPHTDTSFPSTLVCRHPLVGVSVSLFISCQMLQTSSRVEGIQCELQISWESWRDRIGPISWSDLMWSSWHLSTWQSEAIKEEIKCTQDGPTIGAAKRRDENSRGLKETFGKIDEAHPDELAVKAKYKEKQLHMLLGYNVGRIMLCPK